jgi:nicotinamidase-related amidase
MPKEALVIIDMLNDFVLPGAPLEVPDNRKAIPGIKREIEAARREGRAVIYICDRHAPDDREFSRFGWPAHGVKGTRGADIVEDIKPGEGAVVVEKATYSGFYNTKLEEILKGLGVEHIRMTGCVTHICIMFISFELVLRGYEVSVVLDGIAGLAKEDHEAALRIMKDVLGVRLV